MLLALLVIRIRTLNDGVRAPQCFIQNAHFKHVSRLSYLSNVSVNFVVLLNTKPNQIIQFYLLDILMLGWSIVLWFIFLVFFLLLSAVKSAFVQSIGSVLLQKKTKPNPIGLNFVSSLCGAHMHRFILYVIF